MKNVSSTAVKACFGFDLGDTRSCFCLIGESGDVELEGEVPNERKALEEVLAARPEARVVLETSTGSHWIAAHLRSLGREVYEANPRRVALIAMSSRKTDRNDAEMLARIGRADVSLLHPVHPRSGECMEARLLLRVRQQLVSTRTRAVNSVRSSLKVFGYRAPSCSSEGFAKQAWVHVPARLAAFLHPLFELMQTLNGQIEVCDRELAELAKKRFPDSGVLQQIHGVGPLASLAFVTAIGDPKRFRDSRTVGPYLGLTPRSRQSGQRDPRLGISKEGDRMVRTLLVGAAMHILRQSAPDTALKRHGRRLAKSGSPRDKARARVAVARKLAIVMHRLWLTGEVYRPLPANEPAA